MTISILTLFPEIFTPIFSSSIIGRAQKKGLVDIRYVNIRDFSTDKHHSVDDKPYGGGVGMILRVDVVEKAIEKAKAVKTHRMVATSDVDSSEVEELRSGYTEKVILLDPKGKQFNQSKARSFAKLDHLILVCGHYEGIDARIANFVDEVVSIGKYVLTGGEIPAMVVTDAVTRLTPGVLSKKEATLYESYSKGNLLEYPQYTRPENYKGYQVPKVLLSGNHKKIGEWQRQAH
ncbi:tRNA (guanosine(37)-N1)-methyltransferase TrmD [Candidatus Gottesmanbacteria bacterium]|nr:tRNA (guanosine(37)-N1)-methyltransferase TrmD [Candidatus Gottesmanbacteria bacterium]